MLTLDSMEVNKDKQHQFKKPHNFTTEDGNAVISKTEKNFTQKQAGKPGVKDLSPALSVETVSFRKET